MIKKGIIFTNNVKVGDLASNKITVKIYQNKSALEILKLVRDYLHKGYELFSHPLHSSLKPNETPFRSVFISDTRKETIDFYSIEMIESSIQCYKKFLNKKKSLILSEQILNDYSLIDFDLIKQAIN